MVLWDERRTTVSAAAILAGNDTFGQKRKEPAWIPYPPRSFWKVFSTGAPITPAKTPPEQLLPSGPSPTTVKKESRHVQPKPIPAFPTTCRHHRGRQPPLGPSAV